ncbi:16S rRNA (guanine(527)-N(7))-methyltransferase RsmG [Aliiglaciecola sp. 2_MG-2023]|uniref:16S rRNA (guanine(527)-N(7))-methyltransferase RsmG n=1 Tax=unclassified Aliiglaciecola TaxID=2593648 RepID=UPI0026E281AD|nr:MULTISPECIES: 16S rRNA (guanine(527)-N(7))-methyltransferase RsmG [unclassified Aliiglaciecola]MDO6713021.1 16S rRNA (guanine(527)-N(7))-methyltransferase RsmG [Aliiglaciecola sp. 2_MG-2023]MDO6754060.1 16S rRNA (guanine(527)-N(7))-methyltransferase RsmG [Aliiglaciecola sp. 1_MG-2023]
MNELKSSLLLAFDRAVQPLPIEVSEQQRASLVDFVLLMNKWNKAYNLTSVREPQQMLIKHIIDSIVVAPHLDRSHYIDVGTGPGLPGIPLSIMHPDKHFVLLDSLGKRVRFMKQAAFELGLKNIEPVQSRVEQYSSDTQIDGVLSRAFASIKDMLHWCQHLVDSQGEFLALKGQYPEQEIALLPEGFEVLESIKLDIPVLEGERHLIKIRKVS